MTTKEQGTSISGWQRIGKYGMKKPPYYVAKNLVMGQWIYVLYNGNEWIGKASSFEDVVLPTKEK